MHISSPLVAIKNLCLQIEDKEIVRSLSLEICAGEMVSIVGASGSGKTLMALSVIGLLPDVVSVTDGQIIYAGSDLLTLKKSERRKYRGSEIAMIFQEPMSSLNPVMTVEEQIAEAIRRHIKCSASEARAKTLKVLQEVQIPKPEMRMASYPHQLSGGLRQRVMIAMALSCNPRLLIADEPTTALDTTIQANIMCLLHRIRNERNLSILFITHDIALAMEETDRIAIINEGEIVETGKPQEIIENAENEYTRLLISEAKQREQWRSVEGS